TAADARLVEAAFEAKVASLGSAIAAATESPGSLSFSEADPSHEAPQISQIPSNRIDKSQLAIFEARRIRDKRHLRFVAKQPCLVCGRQPSDAHHLRFAQSRGLGLKVSDEFTVPLCRGHHREVHRYGKESQWWENAGINSLEIASKLWQDTHSVRTPSKT